MHHKPVKGLRTYVRLNGPGTRVTETHIKVKLFGQRTFRLNTLNNRTFFRFLN